jgi:ubiquinone/menaquinone biosynthesis C-methylase UbiE
VIHLQDLHHFFHEARRVIKPGGSLIILHNLQRRSYIYDLPGEPAFKVEDYHRNVRDIEEAASAANRSIDAINLEEKGSAIGSLYHLH